MPLDQDHCYAAIRARDARFDGRFFTGVTTTGIFCRPVCPARTPRRSNVVFHPSAASALAAGFRPCRRCRPDAAPGSPAWRGSEVVVERALAAIERGELDGGTTDALAASLGVSARHLGRLFAEQVGTSPARVARARRVLLAHRLLMDTDLPVTDVAFAAGFQSVRQFNDVMRADLRAAPSDLRSGRTTRRTGGRLRLSLRVPVREPFAFEPWLTFHRDRALPGVEDVTADAWQRRVGAGTVSIRRAGGGITLEVDLDDARALTTVIAATRSLLDADADSPTVDEHLARASTWLRRRVRALPGLRVPGPWDPWEAAARVVLGQQVSVGAAATLAGRLVAANDGAFPDAPTLAADPSLLDLGMPRSRRTALHGLACAVADGEIDLTADPATARRMLAALPGIGPWTVEVIALRALRDPDAFPDSDLGVRKALHALGPAAGEVTAAARPWRSYLTVHLWESLT